MANKTKGFHTGSVKKLQNQPSEIKFEKISNIAGLPKGC